MRPVAIAALAWSLAGAGMAQETIRPGYWEAIESVLSPIQSRKIERRCIAAKDVQRFISCYINHHYVCDCPEQSHGDGHLRFSGTCVDHKGAQVRIAGRGTYTETTLHLTAEVRFKLGGLPIRGRASTDAHRLGDQCPGPAAPP
jgi:hypothetical protein